MTACISAKLFVATMETSVGISHGPQDKSMKLVQYIRSKCDGTGPDTANPQPPFLESAGPAEQLPSVKIAMVCVGLGGITLIVDNSIWM